MALYFSYKKTHYFLYLVHKYSIYYNHSSCAEIKAVLHSVTKKRNLNINKIQGNESACIYVYKIMLQWFYSVFNVPDYHRTRVFSLLYYRKEIEKQTVCGGVCECASSSGVFFCELVCLIRVFALNPGKTETFKTGRGTNYYGRSHVVWCKQLFYIHSHSVTHWLYRWVPWLPITCTIKNTIPQKSTSILLPPNYLQTPPMPASQYLFVCVQDTQQSTYRSMRRTITLINHRIN